MNRRHQEKGAPNGTQIKVEPEKDDFNIILSLPNTGCKLQVSILALPVDGFDIILRIKMAIDGLAHSYFKEHFN